MTTTKYHNPQPEDDIFHSEPEKGEIVIDLTGLDFNLTFTTDEDLFRCNSDHVEKSRKIKLNTNRKDGCTHTIAAFVMPICKRKDE